MKTIGERIEYVKEYFFGKERGSNVAFANKVEEKSNTVSNWFSRGDGLGLNVAQKIINAFPEVDVNWLLTGKGTPFINANKHLPTNTNGKGVPYFEDIEASCSILSMNMETPENPTFYIDYEHFNDCNAYIPVVGDSMYPQYCAGEIVAVKQIFNFDVIQWGEAYLIVTNSNANDLRTIKQIHYCDDESKIILRASNPNFKGDTKINKEDIRSLFIIKGKIKRNQL